MSVHQMTLTSGVPDTTKMLYSKSVSSKLSIKGKSFDMDDWFGYTVKQHNVICVEKTLLLDWYRKNSSPKIF